MRHIQPLQELAGSKDVDLQDSLGGIDAHGYRDLFNAIGSLPSLETFTIDPELSFVLDCLVESIARWKIRQFKLRYNFLENVDARRLFDAFANSRNLKRFFLCSAESGQILSFCPITNK